MRPLFANSAHVHVREDLVVSRGGRKSVALKVRYGLVEHPRHGPVLVDAGYGPRVTSAPGRSRLLRAYSAMLRPALVHEQSPESFLRSRGIALSDVRLAVLTHYHADHVAWCRDMPKARFIAHGAAWSRLARATTLEALHNGVFRELLPPDIGRRLDAVEDLPRRPAPVPGIEGFDVLGDGSMLAVDLPGHARGHFGLHFPYCDPPLFYAADAQWMLSAALGIRSPGWPAAIIAHDRSSLAHSDDVVRRFADAGIHVMTCHDPADTVFDAAVQA